MKKNVPRYKYPFEYELFPTEIEKGQHWLTFKFKNLGEETLQRLDVELHSLDTFFLSLPYGTGQYLAELKPNGVSEIVFRVTTIGSADVYATIRGREFFWWESGWMRIYVSDEKATIERLVVLSHPYTGIGKTLSAEATIKGLRKSRGLKLEFWVDSPSGKSEKQAEINMKELSVGEEARYSAEFTPKETGWYSIYAYLYDGRRRIGHTTTAIFVEKK